MPRLYPGHRVDGRRSKRSVAAWPVPACWCGSIHDGGRWQPVCPASTGPSRAQDGAVSFAPTHRVRTGMPQGALHDCVSSASRPQGANGIPGLRTRCLATPARRARRWARSGIIDSVGLATGCPSGLSSCRTCFTVRPVTPSGLRYRPIARLLHPGKTGRKSTGTTACPARDTGRTRRPYAHIQRGARRFRTGQH